MSNANASKSRSMTLEEDSGIKLGTQKRRRQSRWDEDPPEIYEKGKQRKSRWDNNDSQNKSINPLGFIDPLQLPLDPKVISLKLKLIEINQKLQSSDIHDCRPEAERSPSPEPVFNNLGIRINTRDARLRKKLLKEKQSIISELSKANSPFQSSANPKPTKFVKKLFVPVKEYPMYNFLGLILGPKGNTLKKMEKETGARIFVRGKGSGDIESEKKDLHVRVKAKTQRSLDAAEAMIKKLLIPVADQNNYHKKAQLEELAKLRGTHKSNNACQFCKEEGHKEYACPLQESTFKAACCYTCGSFDHSTSICSIGISQTLQGLSGAEKSGSYDNSSSWVDSRNLYICHLPHTVDDKRLRDLFLPFGRVVQTMIATHQGSSLSRGYGIVKFENPADAAAAVAFMDGYKMDGRTLGVRVAEPKASSGCLRSDHVPNYFSPQTAAFPSDVLNRTSCSYGLMALMLPETPNPESMHLSSSSTDPWPTNNNSSFDFCDKIPSSFPGNPDYSGSEFKSYFTSSMMNETGSRMPASDQISGYGSVFRFH